MKLSDPNIVLETLQDAYIELIRVKDHDAPVSKELLCLIRDTLAEATDCVATMIQDECEYAAARPSRYHPNA